MKSSITTLLLIVFSISFSGYRQANAASAAKEQIVYVTLNPTPAPTVTMTAEAETKEDLTTIENPESEDLVPRELLLPGMHERDFAHQGDVVPTVYFKPIIEDSSEKCAADTRINMVNADRTVIASLCRADYNQCLLQGSCQVNKDGKSVKINYVHKIKNGPHIFAIIQPNQCPFGFGVRAICLDPMFSVAADMKYHNPGDVIFIPDVAGLDLGNGKKHHGFFIVRDRGGAIKGEHRFDFFSGFINWSARRNPFRQVGLGDKRTSLPYYKVEGESAEMFVQERAFPRLPRATNRR